MTAFLYSLVPQFMTYIFGTFPLSHRSFYIKKKICHEIITPNMKMKNNAIEIPKEIKETGKAPFPKATTIYQWI